MIKKTKIYVEDRSEVEYCDPYYVINNAYYHMDWYEVIETRLSVIKGGRS